MAGSYREIDYRVRPAKYAERLMMVDAFRRLRFGSIESYQYVGLGSVYFSDFSLIHRTLGISKMVSIEKNEDDKIRFIENVPFRCVEMLWGRTAEQLANVDLNLRSIVWLDYDGRLDRPILRDVADVARRSAPGSILVITVQCKFDRGQTENGEDNSVGTLVESLGTERVPPGLTRENLYGDGTGAFFRDVILTEISQSLAARNIARPAVQHIHYRQILNFRYEDGVKMMTVGVVFYDAGQKSMFDQCEFEQLEFIRSGEQVFKIGIPKLTPREIKLLEAQMPVDDSQNLAIGSIPAKDAEQYVSIYRYFPNITFADS